MNIEIIKALKERAKEMLEDNYNRKIGDEEIYTIICELENFYTAYEKEKETSHYNQSQLDIANAKLVEEKEKNKLLEENYSSAHEDINWFCENYIHKNKLKEIVDECIPKKENIITKELEYTPNANANSYLTQEILSLLKEE